VAGANAPNQHIKNVNYLRDFEVDEIADIATAQTGHGCSTCGQPLDTVRGIEVGHVFKLGTFFTRTIGAEYTDEQGALQAIVMGCYGIGVTRVLAAAIEQNNDDKGVIFPAPIAPFDVHLVALNPDDPAVAANAEALYTSLQAQGYEVLYDDRDERAGVKFNDADLLGLPVRVVTSPRNLENNVIEIKRRRDPEAVKVALDDVAKTVAELLAKDEI
jgi:prolyl-tRNA synthetase